MTYRAKTKNRISVTLFSFTLFLVFFFILMQSNATGYYWIYQLFILIFSIISLEILLKYILSDYIYELKDNNLRVFRIQGKRSVCVACIALSSALGTIQNQNSSKETVKKARVKHNLCKNMFPQSYYIFNFDFNGKNTVLKFEPDSIFVDEANRQIELIKNKDTQRSLNDE